MNRKDEIQIIIPQLEKQYSEAYDVFTKKYEAIQERVKDVVGKVIRMYPKDFELSFDENSTRLSFDVDGSKTGDLTIDHPTTYSTMENRPFRLNWYSTNSCDVNNPHHFVYLMALGKIAEDFNPTDEQTIQPVLEKAIEDFNEAVKEHRKLNQDIRKIKHELATIERHEKIAKVFDEGSIRDKFGVYGSIKEGRTINCVILRIDKVTDKTVTITFTTEYNEHHTKRFKRDEAESLILSIVNKLAKKRWNV